MKTAMRNAMNTDSSALCVEPAESARFPLHADVVENICGTPKADFLKVCECWPPPAHRIAQPPSCTRWAGAAHRGCAEHPYYGDDPVTARNMGMAGGGVNALRGHSNIQA